MMGDNGVIGASGKWYPCRFQGHIEMCVLFKEDSPFVSCHQGDWADTEIVPTKAQFETTMEWCTEMGERFEDVAIGTAWAVWRTDDGTETSYGGGLQNVPPDW